MEKYGEYNLFCFPGCCRVQGGIRFFLESTSDQAGVILYLRGKKSEWKRIPFGPGDRVGRIFCHVETGLNPDEISYAFYEGERIFADPRAKAFEGRSDYGRPVSDVRRAILPDGPAAFEDPGSPKLTYEDSFWYLLHVRGFTKHASSGVRARGTFAGLTEKLDYLQELGVTTLELQPCYDFDEFAVPVEIPSNLSDVYYPGMDVSEALRMSGSGPKLNYWGYKEGYYYAPKAAYCASDDAVSEFRSLVKALHERNMELILQFFFPRYYPHQEILEILRYWAFAYHVDGFDVMGEQIPMQMLGADPVLAGCKLINDHLEQVGECRRSYYDLGLPRRMALLQDDFQYHIRRLLKGDEGMTEGVARMLRMNPPGFGKINFVTSYRGFTLMDLVSYDRKHNEENGEEGRDGNDFNFSWNCGEEGPTRKKKVRSLRIRQVRNALTMLFFGAATPLLFMGDEFGNSQKGNNNPYCIDSAVTWLDWRDLERNREIYDFAKLLVQIRKENPILHSVRELTLMDSKSFGYPDLSYHGESAWRAQMEPYSRSLGILYSNAYATSETQTSEELLYLGINQHWNEKVLSLPRPPKGKRWTLIACTGEAPKDGGEGLSKTLQERSIVIYRTQKDPDYVEKPDPGLKKNSRGNGKHGKRVETLPDNHAS